MMKMWEENLEIHILQSENHFTMLTLIQKLQRNLTRMIEKN